MLKIKKAFKTFFYSKYFPIAFFVLWFVFFIILSLFRDARLDENIYLGESTIIADLLKNGQWIGNYGVGLHGFLSKLLVGTIFIFTGPSVFIATFINILFGIGSGIVFYKILNKNFKLSRVYSLLGVTLLFSNFQFITYIPTFYRDIQSLFFSLLVFNSVLSKKSKWVTGIFLLLLLDSKEHVFYTFGPALVIWVATESIMLYGNSFRRMFTHFLSSCVKLFLPTLIYLILMFTTSIIPLNIYNANILGLIENGTKELVRNFEIIMATYNGDIASNVGIAKTVFLINIPENVSPLLEFIYVSINTLLRYIGKVFYPRTFSFLTIPFLVLIPSLSFVSKLLKESLKKKNSVITFLPIILISYLVVYIFHASIGRYFIPVIPIIIIYFLLFLKDIKQKQSVTSRVILFTFLFAIGGMYFEYNYIGVKIVFNLFILICLLILYFRREEIIKYGIVISISIFTIGTVLLVSYKYGQIGSYLLYGYDRECEKILSLVKDDDVIWINDIGWDRLPFALRSENVQNPEWRWQLKNWVPKKKLLVRNENFKTYNFYWGSIEKFKEKLLEKGIDKILFIQLEYIREQENLLMQDSINIISNDPLFKLEQEGVLRGKEVYIYKVSP